MVLAETAECCRPPYSPFKSRAEGRMPEVTYERRWLVGVKAVGR